MLLQGRQLNRPVKVDMHVHSKYSEHPSEWFLKRLGAKESYTDPETIYRMAIERGMDFVTITDHNRIKGSLLLTEEHPYDTFTGVEFTTYFPEDNCKIHVLVYGLDYDEFEEIQRIRNNIYHLRSYLGERQLAHSVAHATYPVNGMLEIEHLEKLILMFNVFEGTNGGRNKVNNHTWTRVLESLDENRLEDLRLKHGIEPWGPTPWIKGLTGGSDDHAGLFIGQTCTLVEALSPSECLQEIRRGQAQSQGRSNNYQSLVFTVYKIAYEFSRDKPSAASRSLFSSLTEYIFERRNFKFREKVFLKKLATSRGRQARLYRIINELIDEINQHRDDPMQNKLDILYARIAELSDEFVRVLVKSIKKDVNEGDVVGFITNASASIPGVFLLLPFFTAVRDMFSNKTLLDRLERDYLKPSKRGRDMRVLWFTDTFTDLNGVSVTLDKISRLAAENTPGFRIVTALSQDEMERTFSDNVILLPYIDSFSLPGYEKYVMKVPSILKSLDLISRFEPDRIYISTPGPVGLTGLLIARLMNTEVTGFYHTDYAKQVTKIVSDESVNDIIEGYIKWFYSCFDEVRVPTDEYIGILRHRGYEFKRVVKFFRGIDTDLFSPGRTVNPRFTYSQMDLSEPVLAYTGRISRDKDLNIAFEAYRRILDEYPGTVFLVAGDGPYLEDLREEWSGVPGIVFLGLIPNHELPGLYSRADLFVFPSESDTFGMSVLEAQSCGVPAVVSSVGGPSEIIEDGVTGMVARAGDIEDWTRKIVEIIRMKTSDDEAYQSMCRNSRERVMTHFDWNSVFDSLFSLYDAEVS
ncbi:MAG: glycosyltransferase [Candidatus Fermentibacteraceae bacterium]|nr:glycosyltransferase [Candidatus Fermentibacteraceae bacterium]MBN2609901.1 glycosyltransferase [Candidatus Fermentibacteraceae bacterium]